MCPSNATFGGEGVTLLHKRVAFIYFSCTVQRLIGRILLGCAAVLKGLLVAG